MTGADEHLACTRAGWYSPGAAAFFQVHRRQTGSFHLPPGASALTTWFSAIGTFPSIGQAEGSPVPSGTKSLEYSRFELREVGVAFAIQIMPSALEELKGIKVFDDYHH